MISQVIPFIYMVSCLNVTNIITSFTLIQDHLMVET